MNQGCVQVHARPASSSQQGRDAPAQVTGLRGEVRDLPEFEFRAADHFRATFPSSPSGTFVSRNLHAYQRLSLNLHGFPNESTVNRQLSKLHSMNRQLAKVTPENSQFLKLNSARVRVPRRWPAKALRQV